MLSASKILIKRSSVEGAVPTNQNLSFGELALNIADGNIFFKNTNEDILTFEDASKNPYTLDNSLSSINTKIGSNTVTGVFAAVHSGYNNDVSGSGSSVINGENNDIESDFALIGNGLNNFIGPSADFGGIFAGQNNQLLHKESFILGSNITSHLSGVTYVNDLSAKGTLYGDGTGLYNTTPKNVEQYVTKSFANQTYLPLSATSISTDQVSALQLFAEILSITSQVLSSVIFTVTDKVGVNTPTPNEALTVNGNVSATGYYYGNGSLLTGLYQGTDLKGLSANWQNTYTNVQSNSSNWTQTLSFNESNKNLSISSGNVVSLSSLLDDTGVDTGVRAITGTFATNTNLNSVSSQLVLTSDFNSYKTNVSSVTSTLLPTTIYQSASSSWQNTFTNFSSNSASYSTKAFVQSNFLPLSGGVLSGSLSAQSISASEILISSSDEDSAALFVSSQSKIGIKTESPNEVLTVVGNISATGNLFAEGYNSSNWNSVYSNVLANSATNWNYQGTDLKGLSANWQNTYTNVQSNSAQWASNIDTGLRTLSGNWQSTYTTVQSNSGSWLTSSQANASFLKLSGGEISGSLSVQSLSATNLEISPNSDVATLYTTTSAVGINTESPNQALTVVGNISATGYLYGDGSQLTGIAAGGSDNEEVNTVVQTTSATWNDTTTVVQSNSAIWSSAAEVTRRFDYVPGDPSFSYSGIAIAGSLESDEVWTINRIAYTQVGSISASGTATNVAWTDRVISTYI